MYLFNPETNDFASRPELAVVAGAYTPTALYNAMIAPLTPYTLKGAIWYQGETNVGRSAQYVRLKSMLINDWRTQFENGEMPFYFVQLAPWHNNNVEGSSSAKIRDAQRRTLSIAHTGMAVTLDIGNVDNIHPANKTDVGERLALWALANDYGKQIPYSGPLYESFSVEGNKLTLTFSHVDGGLVLKDQVPGQFELAGDDGVFYPAKAVVEGNQIVLTSPRVAKPINARYAYKNGSEASLFNGAGLPAASFTTEAELID
jgi:sialate O-acetylesterase